jgi:hypothetical protein
VGRLQRWVQLAGTVRTAAALATARTTGADRLANRAAAGSSVVGCWARGGGVSRMAAGGTARPCPWGLGSMAPVPTAATAATVVSPAPRARLRPSRARSQGENRTGSSTSFTVAAASRPLAAARPRLRPSPRGWPATAGARISSGQCHRYQEYDSLPPAWRGRQPSRRLGPNLGAAQPAASTAAVPPTGNSAAVPGNGVDALNWTIDHRMASRPSQPSVAAATPGRRCSAGAANATRPPAASSQARVGREKNAHGWDTAVSRSDSANDPAATSASAAAAATDDLIANRRPARNTASSSSGHSR